MKKYYTYKLTDKTTGEYYFGSRGYDGEIKDDKYMGSPYVWKPIVENLQKEILDLFDNSFDAIMKEREFVINHITDIKNQNYSIPHPNITRENLISAVDKFGNILTICVDDPLFGIEFFGVTKGKTMVRDIDGNIFQVSVNDERYLSGELVHNNKFTNIRGIDHPNYNKHWINNGKTQKLVSDNIIPDGWVIGTLQKGKRTVSSHYKTIWINDETINKRITNDKLYDYIGKGWNLGRINLKKYEKRKKL